MHYLEYRGTSMEDDGFLMDETAIEGRSGQFQSTGKSFQNINLGQPKTKTRGSNNQLQKAVTKNKFRQKTKNQRFNNKVDCDFYTSDLCLRVNDYPM